ncbi:MAG: hypothetical protein J6U88_02330 [Bacteroidales bacterium]|nr:hypothetical protein [Bacteroidales bacterium]
MMKRVILTAIMLCSLVMGSCTKSIDTNIDTEIQISFSVGEKGGFGTDTKALRTGWEAGDQILVVFSKIGSNTDLGVTSTLTYDGTNWSATGIPSEKKALLGSSGNFKAVHYRSTAGDVGIDGIRFTGTYGGPGYVLECTGTYNYINYPEQFMLNGNLDMVRADFCETQISVPATGLDDSETWYLFVSTLGDNSTNELQHYVLEGACGLLSLNSDFELQPTITNYAIGEKIGGDYVFTFSNKELKVGDEIDQDEFVTQKQLGTYIFILCNNSSWTSATKLRYYIKGRGAYDDVKKDYQYPLEVNKAYKLPTTVGYANWYDIDSIETLKDLLWDE